MPTRNRSILASAAFIALSAAAWTARAGAAEKPAIDLPFVVEVVVTPGATLLDFAGPAEVFGVMPPHTVEYLVSEATVPFKLENGVAVVPDYTFDTAPEPDIVIIGSQDVAASAAAIAWLRKVHAGRHIVMSVCTGADWLGQAGLLEGLQATTNHNAADAFQGKNPSVKVVRGRRYVQSDPYLFTAGGYTAGVDLGLHIVDMRLGREAARAVARRLEYQGEGWITNEWR